MKHKRQTALAALGLAIMLGMLTGCSTMETAQLDEEKVEAASTENTPSKPRNNLCKGAYKTGSNLKTKKCS
ncbi:hypothetical protein [Shewanella sedimentimangrovi]|uniref:Lipoprotein n=1 Tax=Shewanella sedimentimangrovi TaxID=2814293 RepID=A0ABX7R366_9GAMM|nr:hypothetical protein [Shewanella sedimentimangrovi]QSX38251.1 hypothetical protein JYB85_05340 [Shewanella sedimentimangrovi]